MVYTGQLVATGTLKNAAAYTVATSLSTRTYLLLNPWLHASHQHIVENAIIFAILGGWTEKRIGSVPLMIAVLVTGYLTNLSPAILGFGGLGIGASGITNALWAHFTVVQFFRYADVIQDDSRSLRKAAFRLALAAVGLLFVLRSVAEFYGYIQPSSGDAAGAHLLGVVLGFLMFTIRELYRCLR